MTRITRRMKQRMAAMAAFLLLPFGACLAADPPAAAADTGATASATTSGFTAQVSAAPASGTTVSGKVRLEVTGTNLQNVELLPAEGYLPRLGVFNISDNHTFAWLDFDSRLLPGGSAAVRISAFDAPAGQPADEIVAMPARTWTASNPPPPTGGMVGRPDAAPGDNSIVQGTTRISIVGNRMENVELLPAEGYLPRLGVFNIAADGSTAWLDFDSRSVPDGLQSVRVSIFSRPPGQPGASEYVAMQPRRWHFQNGASPDFTVTSTVAPLHGETISGVVHFEVRGSGIRNAELLPASGYLPRIATFNVSRDGSFAWLDLHTDALPAGALNARVSVFNVDAGQPDAKEIVAIPAREWTIAR